MRYKAVLLNADGTRAAEAIYHGDPVEHFYLDMVPLGARGLVAATRVYFRLDRCEPSCHLDSYDVTAYYVTDTPWVCKSLSYPASLLSEKKLRRVIDVYTPLDDTKKDPEPIAPYQAQANAIFGAFCRVIELPAFSSLADESLDLAARMIDKVCRGQGVAVSLLRESYLDYLESLMTPREDDERIEL